MTTATKKKTKRYRLLRGSHSEGAVDPANPDKIVPQHVYRHNESNNNIVESPVDLVQRFGKEKFELLMGDTPVSSQSNNTDIDAMTAEQLKSFALENEIDLGALTGKKEICNHIRATLDAR